MEQSSKLAVAAGKTIKDEGKFKLNAKSISKIGMLSAIAAILMVFEIPVPWIAPPFYQIDFSEVPILIGGFALGPAAGVLIVFIKNLLKVAITGTATGGVGEVANFLIGCAFVLPSAIYYKRNKTRKGAAISLGIGTISMTILGSLLNAFVLLPVYASAFGVPVNAIIEMGTAINSKITGLSTFVLMAVAPFNLFKGALVSFITFLIYKKIRGILH